MNNVKSKLRLTALALLLGLAARAEPGAADVALSCDAPGNVFTDSAGPSFQLAKDKGSNPIHYEVRDWRGASVAKGVWERPASTSLAFATLPRGYYTLAMEGFEGVKPFAVVVDPAERRSGADSFHAVNCMPSWLAYCCAPNPRKPEDAGKALAELARLAGITTVREMLRWGDEVSAQNPCEYDWSRYLRSSEEHFAKGVKFCGYFEDAPAWAKRDTARHASWHDYYKPTESAKLPENLFALHEFARNAAATFKGRTDNWEFWNEEDTEGYCVEPAWDFAAAQKVAALGVKAGNPAAKVLNGSFCQYPFNKFHEGIFDNGVGPYLDIFNNHIYGEFTKYPEIMRGTRDLLRRHGLEGMPVWITENGSGDNEGPGRARSFMQSGGTVYSEHDADQELILAEFVPKAMTLLQSLGVSKDFLFTLHPVNERNRAKAWGLLRWDYSAKPAYVALANLTRQLERAERLGELKPAAGVRGFLYRMPDGTQTLVFWSESELDKATSRRPEIDIKNLFAKEVSIAVPSSGFLGLFGSGGELKLTDLMGRESPVKAEGGAVKVEATRFPAYLSGLAGLEPDEPSPSPVPGVAADPNLDLSIVLRARLSDDFYILGSRDTAALKGKSGKLFVDVFNFSDKSKEGALESLGGGSVEGLPRRIVLAPMGRMRLELAYLPSGVPSSLRLGGAFLGKRVTPLSIPVMALGDRGVASLEVTDPGRWRANSSGKMVFSRDAAEKALKVHVDFSGREDGDYWAYPEFALALPAESLAGAVAISFEVKAVQKDGAKKFPHSKLMLVYEDVKEKGESDWLGYPPPDEAWGQRCVAIDSDKAKGAKLLRLGMGSSADGLDFWLRNVEVHYGTLPPQKNQTSTTRKN